MWVDVAVHENGRFQPVNDHVKAFETAVWGILAIAYTAWW